MNPFSMAAQSLDVVPFDQIKNEDFKPAFDDAFADARRRLDLIRKDQSEPSFVNTIEALEFASEELDRVSNVFSNLLHAHTNETLQGLAKEVMPRLADFSNDISLDEKLFVRVKAVFSRRQELGLDGEQDRLLDKTYKFFVRNGALLAPDRKQRLREVDSRLATLGEQFSDHVLKATNDFALTLTDAKDLEGLPESVIEAASLEAKQRGTEGWVFTLQQPSYVPFLKFSHRRELREKMWRAYMSRATSGEVDNRPVAREIASLRHERAVLLGYETHAHFVLEERMASHPKEVEIFLKRLFTASKSAAERDVEEVRKFAGVQDLKPWDFAFYSEKLQKARYGFDEEQLRPYFKLENVVEGVFEHARRLFGIVFKKRSDIPVYHPEVAVYEVMEENGGRHLGYFYADFFPRASKRGGAWMTTFREQGYTQGQIKRPLVSIVCNLSKPTASKPSLLSLDEVRTIFHEFGHALHSLLSDCRYRSISGTNVYWDFVELPSQIMENWTKEKESLDLFARHFETGAKMPEDLIEKLKQAEKFQAGYFSLRQLAFAHLDLAWHAGNPAEIMDVEKFEEAAVSDCTLFPHEAGSIISCGFSHIFAGGYSAGYYSYKWAEVLDADAFEFFQEKGLFNQDVAKRFRESILSRGGTEHPMTLYKRFRGREPDPNALLRRDGLI